MRRGSGFIFDRVDLLHYQLQKTGLSKKGRSCTDSSEWLRNEKAKVNPNIMTIIAFNML